ncbi:beta-glucoside-specific PTS transporter subunit IIABC [Vagococcus fluvialis]|uniref:beta-glucoside-specific PTS transporter subunit IIABC n=1 Tax=Vagococcus fluvialis TaxID=2738 RepID=UPI001A904155|nr:beta-glucoside-specific PTS transporter subunit IIABC [Vagococcus fluvialis]MBO0444594.1 PTS glucose transporter subunit IIA [Vagococcus fluvialis]MDT2747216.1 beta-glucoside-specific PTS transporter subunit IIABC [Vagococcus fluvialis]
MEKYQGLAAFIIENVGGKENILSVTHCMTRLRFTLNDDAKVKEENLVNSPEIMTAQFAGGRYQVVVGTHVSDVFQVIQSELGLLGEEEVEEKKGGVNRLIEIITKVITPVLGILTASGLLQGILALLTVTNVLSEGDGAYIVLHAMGQTVFYFLPVVLGYTSAKAFKLNPFVGMMLGAILLIPELMTNLVNDQVLYTLFQGSIFETDIHNTFFGIPILFPANGYQYSVIPIIFITFLGSKVEKFLKRVVPELLAHNLNAFLTILITFPLSILIIGPVTNVLSSLISAGVSGLYAISPVITSVVVGLLYQPLVIFGLHWPMSAIGINNLAQYGVDYIFPMSFTANFAQTAVVLAVYLKTRSKEQKALAIPAMVSGIFCIIEPAIYGFSLPVKKRFIFSMIGGAVGSFILAISATKMYAFAFGILGFVSFINPENGSLSGLYIAIFASIVTMIVSFCLTYFTFKEEEDVVDSTKKTLVKTEAIYSPVEGEVLSITMASDQSFALEMMGKGVVIKPKNGKITSPINGVIKTIFPGGHAIGIESPSGVEVLIHIGVDTVELKGEGFEILANVDDEVVVGQELVNVNLALLSELNVKDEVMVVITNTPEFLDVIPEESVTIKKGKKIITVIPFSQSKEAQMEVAHS